jgi:hypothetical protein
MSHRQRHLGYAIAALGLLFIAGLTLVPQPDQAAEAAATPLSCIVCGEFGGVDFLLNILLFIPLGIGLAVAGFSWRRTVVLAGLLTFGIELLQMNVIAGRDASLGDILTNTLGGGIGAALGTHWRTLVFPRPVAARRLAVSWALVLFWIWAGTAWALGPTWPQGVRWYGQWANDLGYLAPFLGKPLMVTAGGEPLPPGPSIDQSLLEDAVAARPELAVRAVLAGPTPKFAPIGSIMDEWRREIMFLGQDGQALEFRLRMRAALFKLRNPTVALPHALSGHPGDTVDAEGALRDGVFELSARDGDRVSSRRLPLSASWGWSLVLPWRYAFGPEVYLLTALWIAGLLGLLAYWSLLAGAATIMALPLSILTLLVVIPSAASLRPVHWTEWLAAGVGTLLGGLAARSARAADVSRGYEDEPTR